MGGYVHILANRRNGALYTGVSDLPRRITQHREGTGSGFATQWDIHKLVYAEPHGDIAEAIAREKAIKKWRRDWKIGLIERDNPDWRDLLFDINA